MRKLKRLEEAMGVTVVDPIRDERGWAFRDGPGYSRDPVNGFQFLREAYRGHRSEVRRAASRCRCCGTRKPGVIVNNSEDDICRMFNGVFSRFGDATVDLFPARHRAGAG